MQLAEEDQLLLAMYNRSQEVEPGPIIIIEQIQLVLTESNDLKQTQGHLISNPLPWPLNPIASLNSQSHGRKSTLLYVPLDYCHQNMKQWLHVCSCKTVKNIDIYTRQETGSIEQS